MSTTIDNESSLEPTDNSSANSPESSTELAVADDDAVAAPSTPGRRARRILPVAVGVAAVAGAVAIAANRGDDDADIEAPVELTTATAEVGDLVRFTELDGRMVYADTDLLTSPAEGLVTGLIVEGEVVERGSVVAVVDGRPVVALVGDIPLYRPLGGRGNDDLEGDDVLLLEQNLASLGYHTELGDDDEPVDDGFVVDGVWDDATTAAVERWQEDLGVEAIGQVMPTDVVVIAGTAQVIDVPAEVGDRVAPGAPLVGINTLTEVEATHVAHGGEIAVLAEPGEVIRAGDVIYTVDDLPITALVAPGGIDRELRRGVDDGEDVRAVEAMLADLGYDDGGDMVVDDEFDDATETAVTEWQEDLQKTWDDVVADGRVGPDELFALNDSAVVGTLTPTETDTVAAGSELWSSAIATTTRIVETNVATADQERLTVDTVVDVEFADGTTVEGTVVDVASATTVDPTDPTAESTLAVEIALADVPDSADELVEADVTVKLVDELAADVVIVPVAALVARGGGEFAVEAVTTSGTTFITVEPGMFDDGFVEVDGLQAGAQVVVP